MTSQETYAVVMAAGKGTRMKSKLYKVLHPVCGKTMVEHVLHAIDQTNAQETFVVVGHGAESVKEQLGSAYTFVHQKEQLGTGHAVMVAREYLEQRRGRTLVMCGDTPLVSSQTLQSFLKAHEQAQSSVSVLTAHMDDPTGYGRILRNKDGHIERIVEQKEATPEEQRIKEVNTGIYCFDNQRLMYALERITNDNAKGEYYLTDCLQVLHQAGDKAVAYMTPDAEETMGVNDRVALAQAQKAMQRRINEQHMRQGVSMVDPDHTYIDVDVQIGTDTLIHPGTIIKKGSIVEEDCVIGPETELDRARVGQGSTVERSKVVQTEIGRQTSVGPYAYLRPGTVIGDECKIGDFVEVKNAQVQNRSKIPHLSYVGDAYIGEEVNMSCGAITVNYDGERKHRTVVQDGSFIGCNVNLIAPVTIEKGAYVAAGSTVTESVPPDSLAIARERQTTKKDYVPKLKQKRQNKLD